MSDKESCQLSAQIGESRTENLQCGEPMAGLQP
jgi:hypothetical protein